MAIQIQKPVAKADLLTKNGNLTALEQQTVDELYALDKEIAPFRPKIKEFDAKKKLLASVAADTKRFDKEQPAILKGEKGVVEFGAISHPREISDKQACIAALKKKLGYDKLLEVLDIPLSVIDEYLTEAESAPFVKKVDGSRSIKGVRSKD